MDRRARHGQQTREQVLAAAHAIVAAEGAGAVTMRRIAQAVDYSAPVLYQHFAGKEALLGAVAEDGYRTLAQRLDAAAEGPDPDLGLLLAVGQAYLDFAADHPHLYDLMVGTGATRLDGEARARAAQPVVEVVRDVLRRWAGDADVPDAQLDERCEICWGVLHGMTDLGTLEDIGFARAWRLTVSTFTALAAHWAAEGASTRRS